MAATSRFQRHISLWRSSHINRCVLTAAKKAADLGYDENEMVAPSDVLTLLGAPERITSDITNMRAFNCGNADGWRDLMLALHQNTSALILLGGNSFVVHHSSHHYDQSEWWLYDSHGNGTTHSQVAAVVSFVDRNTAWAYFQEIGSVLGVRNGEVQATLFNIDDAVDIASCLGIF